MEEKKTATRDSLFSRIRAHKTFRQFAVAALDATVLETRHNKSFYTLDIRNVNILVHFILIRNTKFTYGSTFFIFLIEILSRENLYKRYFIEI